MKITINRDPEDMRNKLEALAGGHDQTMRCKVIDIMFADEAEMRKVNVTDAFRLWSIAQLSQMIAD